MLDSIISVDGYEMDSMVYRYLVEYLTDIERMDIINIINELCSLNECEVVYNKFDPNILEEEILKFIDKYKEESKDTIRIIVVDLIKNALIDYIGRLGFYLDIDISLKNILQIIIGLRTILNPDSGLVDYLLHMLEDTENETEVIFSNMIAEYSTLSGLEVYELLLNVDPRLIPTLTSLYSTLLEKQSTSPIPLEVMSALNTLVAIEPKYVHTRAYKIVLENGKLIDNFLPYLDTVYNILNTIGEEYTTLNKELPIFNMLIEITSFLYLSIDTRDIIPDAYKTYINLDAIQAFRITPNALNIAEELINKIIEDLEVKG